MLPKVNRLTKKEDFIEVKSKGKKIQSNSFAFAYLAKNEVNASRFGFVVSTKISKRAVDRNRVKRVLRNILKDKLTVIENGFDGVFLVKQSILKVDSSNLAREVEQILFKTGIVA